MKKILGNEEKRQKGNEKVEEIDGETRKNK